MTPQSPSNSPNTSPQPGRVYLVGAGPGDPGLISLRAVSCLQRADLVLYDGLVNPLLLSHTHAAAERTCRTSEAGERILNQDEINQRLIDTAREGKTVVRLKGGDPYIFGRGSEEAAALVTAGIPFEVVPGISAATAASVYAGFSLTHRDFASAVAFITGHEDPRKADSMLDYDALARFPGSLVFYMGLHRLESIVSSLMEAGKAAETPAAVISKATTPAQRTVVAELAELPAAVRKAALRAPSLIVIGECVQLREKLQWFEHRPLFGLRIGITRPEGQTAREIERTIELGAQPVLIPTIQILPPESFVDVDAVLDSLEDFDWIVFTSVNGVRGLFDRLWEQNGDIRRIGKARLAAIGTGTADMLQEYHLRADLIPPQFRAEALAEALVPHVAGKRVLWARASRGRDVLPTMLEKAGADLRQVVVYQNRDIDTLSPELLAQIEAGELDWIGLSSPSIARNLQRLLSSTALARIGESTRLASISPVTTAAAIEVGLPIHAEATTYTWEGIFQAIQETVEEDRPLA